MTRAESEEAGAPLARLGALLRLAQGRRTQADLVKATGLAKATVSSVLRGKGVPLESTLEALTRALNMSDADTLEAFRLRKAADPLERRLSAYLEAARLAAQEHPYPGVLPGTIPPLAAVYLRQHVSQIDSFDTGRPSDSLEPPTRGRAALAGTATDDATDIRRLAQRNWQIPQTAEEALAGGGSSVILSGPGGGKSSLLRTLLTEHVDCWINTHEGANVPVLVPASALVDNPLAQAVAAAVNKDLAPYGLVDELPASFFAAPPQLATAPDPKAPPSSVGWLILIDGFDEITDRSARRRVLRMIATISAETQGLYQFILATRPLPYGELSLLPPDVPRYDLLPFRAEDVEKVAGSWFRALGVPDPETVALRFCLALERTRLMDLARIPLMIAMLSQIHAAAPDQPLPAGRGHIYARFVGLLHARQHESRRLTFAQHGADLAHYPGAFTAAEETLKNLSSIVTHLAAERFRGNTSPSLSIIRSQAAAERPFTVPDEVWSDFLLANLGRTGLLTSRGGDLVFLHQTLMEYLAAQDVGKDPREADRILSDVFKTVTETGAEAPNSLRMLSQSSFVGFLIDTADPQLVADHLHRLTSRPSGLSGCEFIAQQVELGTSVPEAVVRRAADRCWEFADVTPGQDRLGRRLLRGLRLRGGVLQPVLRFTPRVPTQPDGLRSPTSDNSRYRSAVALVQLGDTRGTRTLQSLATDTASDPNNRLRSLKRLVEISSPPNIECVQRVISDARNRGWFRVSSAEILAGAQGADGTTLLLTLAHDRAIGPRSRIAAANALIRLDDTRGAEILHAIATDPELDHGSRRKAAKSLVVNRDDLRSRSTGRSALFSMNLDDYADILHSLATDRTLDSHCRLDAADALNDLDDSRGLDLFDDLALDTGLTMKYRIKAAARLAEQQDSRGADRLAELAGDVTVGGRARVRAAELLSGVDDDLAGTLLYSLAADQELGRKVRAAAAMLLASLGDCRSIDLLIALALDPSYHGNARIEAADLMIELQDERGLTLLVKLARDREIDGWLRTRAAELAASHRDLQSPELLYSLANDRSMNKAAQGAAEVLAGLGDPRGADILAALAGRRSVALRNRLDAAEALAAMGDPRGPDLLYALATQRRSSDPGGRVEAAKVLASLDDPRGVDLLNDFATHRLSFNRWYRWQADAALEDLGLPLPTGHYFFYFFRRRITTNEVAGED